MTELTSAYWQARWEAGNTPWDMGGPSPALIEYVAQRPEKDMRVLIPGAGSGHEAIWLRENGYPNVSVLDIAESAFDGLRKHADGFPENQLINEDFFSHAGTYDLILEQTFFCALDPEMRPAYATKMHELLAPGGTLAGLLFDFPLAAGPPFGGSVEEYRSYFEPFFEVKTMQRATNSIKPRAGSELFFILKRKN